jgi:1-deoxyxylulose-5-phosphate synthase
VKYVRLGASGLKVSRVCLGCMSYGSSAWRPWVLELEAARPFFQRALEAGITAFDTADYYSTGQSEVVTGQLLKEMAPRDEIVIATKVGLEMKPAPTGRGLSRKHISEGIDASLRRLGTDYIDLYQIHRLDRDTPMEEICAALDSAVRAGKVLYLGASSMWAWEFMRLLGIQRELGLSRFVSMQNHYNLLYREEEREMIPLCISEGIGIIPWSPMARGVLTRPLAAQTTARSGSDQYTPTLYGAAHDAAILAALESAAQRLGKPMAQVALAWLLSRPGVTAPIVGVTKLSQLIDAIDAVGLALDEEVTKALAAPYGPRTVVGIS